MQVVKQRIRQPKNHIDVTGLDADAVRAVRSVVALLRRENRGKQQVPSSAIIGLFRDQSRLLDQIVEEAMITRESQPLRRRE
jgi:hypothetical protein